VRSLLPAVAVMAKMPGAIPVKSRLHAALGSDVATELYRCFLLDRLNEVAELSGVTPVLAFTPAEARQTAAALAPSVFQLVAQSGDGLGARLVTLFAGLLGKGHRGAVVMDSDSPTLPMGYVCEALTALEAESTDVVLGPSDDGGYYLVGLRAPAPSLFEGIPWSTERVLTATRDASQALGLRVHLLPAWFDVDTEADLSRLRRSLEGGHGRPSRTRAFLRNLPR
jgi:uncharacterized protein